MTRLKFLFIFLMIIGATAVFAQGTERKVSKIEAGTVLTKDHVGFLTLVSGIKVSKTNPDEITSVKVAGKKYTVGQSLSQSDADNLNAAITDYSKSNAGISSPSEDKNTTPPTTAKTRALKKDKNGLTYCLCCFYWYQSPYDGLWYKYWYWCWV
jgi:hypothetical protein